MKIHLLCSILLKFKCNFYVIVALPFVTINLVKYFLLLISIEWDWQSFIILQSVNYLNVNHYLIMYLLSFLSSVGNNLTSTRTMILLCFQPRPRHNGKIAFLDHLSYSSNEFSFLLLHFYKKFEKCYICAFLNS